MFGKPDLLQRRRSSRALLARRGRPAFQMGDARALAETIHRPCTRSAAAAVAADDGEGDVSGSVLATAAMIEIDFTQIDELLTGGRRKEAFSLVVGTHLAAESDVSMLKQVALGYLRLKEFASAIEVLTRVGILEGEPTFGTSFALVEAKCLTAKGVLERYTAQRELTSVILRGDFQTDLWFQVALLYKGLNEVPQALSAISQAILIDPSNTALRTQRINWLVASGSSNIAINEINVVLDMTEIAPVHYVDLADQAIRCGKRKLAERVYERHLRRAPDAIMPLLSLCRLLSSSRSGRAKARSLLIPRLERILVRTQAPSGIVAVANCLLALGETKMQYTVLENSLSRFSNDADILNAMRFSKSISRTGARSHRLKSWQGFSRLFRRKDVEQGVSKN